MIKIDVEGMEADVLRGAIETIRKYVPIIYVEIFGDTAEVDDILAPHGYHRHDMVYNATPTYLYTNAE